MDSLPSNTATWVSAPPFALPIQTVNEATVLGVPAAWRAVNLIANTVANCAPRVMDGFTVVRDTWVERPCSFYTPYEYYHEMAVSLLLHGNWVAVKVYDEAGFVSQLVPLPADQISCRIEKGRPVYNFNGVDYDWDEVVHVRGLTQPGVWWGVGVIEAHRRGMGLAIDQIALQSNQLRTGGVPSVVIQMPVAGKDWSADLAETVREDWVKAQGAAQKRPAVIPQGMSVTPMSMSNQDMEFLSGRSFSVAEIAFMFGLSPQDLGATIGTESLTYSTLETREAARMKDIQPWMSRIEQRLTELLPRPLEVRFVPEKQLRADTKSRYEAYTAALAGGWMTVDEVRALEGLPALPAPSDDAVEAAEPNDSPTEEGQEQ